MEMQLSNNKTCISGKTPVKTFEWEKLSVEERKRRVKMRMQNLGKYKGFVVFNNPKLTAEG